MVAGTPSSCRRACVRVALRQEVRSVLPIPRPAPERERIGLLRQAADHAGIGDLHPLRCSADDRQTAQTFPVAALARAGRGGHDERRPVSECLIPCCRPRPLRAAQTAISR